MTSLSAAVQHSNRGRERRVPTLLFSPGPPYAMRASPPKTQSKPTEFSVRPKATSRLNSCFGQMARTVQDPGHVRVPIKISIATNRSPGRPAGSPEEEHPSRSQGGSGRAPLGRSPGRSSVDSAMRAAIGKSPRGGRARVARSRSSGNRWSEPGLIRPWITMPTIVTFRRHTSTNPVGPCYTRSE